MSTVNPIPAGFRKRIHECLKSYHDLGTDNLLVDLLLAKQIILDHPDRSGRFVTNHILDDGLAALKPIDPEVASVLQDRFIDNMTAREVAQERHRAETTINRDQRIGIDKLSTIIWESEDTLRREQLKRIFNRLNTASYSQLFGVEEKLAEIEAAVVNSTQPWIVALQGIGGIGKTALADATARALSINPYFTDIGWVSARQRLFQGISDFVSEPQLGLDELVERLIDQFGLTHLRLQDADSKQRAVRRLLNENPYLIVVDNLDSLEDYEQFVAQITDFANQTVFLITSRLAVQAVNGVRPITITELSQRDALAFIRHHAQEQGQTDVAAADDAVLAQIFALTGGHPLAIKLFLGQLHTLPLQQALNLFQHQVGDIEAFFKDIYAHIWQNLNDHGRALLQALQLVTDDGGDVAQIAAAAGLDETTTAATLLHLAKLSLIVIQGNLDEKRYTLHQITQTFLDNYDWDDNDDHDDHHDNA